MTIETTEPKVQEGQAGAPLEDTQKPVVKEPAPETVNWQERYKEAEAKVAKLDSDLKAAKGRNKPIESLEARIAALQEDLTGMRQGLVLVGKALDSGETGKVATEIEQLQQQTAGRSVLAQIQRDTMKALEEAVVGDDGEPLFDVNAVPELNDVRVEYNEALAAKNPMALSLAAMKAVPIINRLRASLGEAKVSKKVSEAVKQAKDEAAAEIEKTKRDLGVLPGPVGGAGAPTGVHETYERLSAIDTRGMGQKALADHTAKLDAARLRGR